MHNSISLLLWKKLSSFTVVVLLLVSMVAITYIVDISASAHVTRTQIDRLRTEKRDYESQKREVQAKIDAIEFDHMTEMSKKEVLDQRIMLTDLEIRNINETITQFNNLIREKEYEVFLAQGREEEQLQRYRSRVRDMEENGLISYLEIIFDSTSFSDLLARIDFIGDIMRADRKLYDDLQVLRNETEDAKVALEEIKVELEEEKEQLEVLEAELYVQLEEAQNLILQLEAELEAESLLRDEIAAEEQRVQREINAAVEQLRRQEEAERQRRLREQQNRANNAASSGNNSANSGGSGNPGRLLWPVPGGRIVSRFGVPRGDRFHSGLDIGAAHGANIVASESGTVIASRYGPGLGYYVTIAHGNGLQTLYGHNSSNAVNVGDTVSRGQVVGYVGSSGNATTPHVHFEVFVNGVRVNPERWL